MARVCSLQIAIERVGGLAGGGVTITSSTQLWYTLGCSSTGLKQTKYQPKGCSFPKPPATAETNWISQSNPHAHSTATHNIQSITLSASDNRDTAFHTSSRNNIGGGGGSELTFLFNDVLFVFLKITKVLENSF